MTAQARTLADMTPDDIRAAVAERYGRAARTPAEKLGFPVGRAFAEAVGYDSALLDKLPASCSDSFTGAGNPRAHIDAQPGETALDLGCGAGLDLICTARMLGPTGRIFGLDLSPDMLAKAQRNLDAAGVANAALLEAPAERIPLPDASVDLLTANGIVNLSPDKDTVIVEMARVCRPGGRAVFSEIVLAELLDAHVRTTIDDWFRCIGGALLEDDLLEKLRAAGFRTAQILDRQRNARTGHPASRSAVIRAER
ncbi:MAG: methyltransferase domain-containing protein [Phycisphaerales bacterium]